MVGESGCGKSTLARMVTLIEKPNVLRETGVRGLMIGRGAIRNPWLFDQIRAQFRGEKIKLPVL